MTDLVVVDTGSGNLRSVEKALAAAGGRPTITGDAAAIARAPRLVVPGQGAFGGCVAGLDAGGGALRQVVREAIDAGKPYLGICLGLQILFEGSDESPGCTGLGVLGGRVTKFAPRAPAGEPLKVPHMGWSAVARGPAASAPAFAPVRAGAFFYFVHSYYAVPREHDVIALEAEHGVRFCAAVARGNLMAVQFHPEKSQAAGLALLRSFLAI